MSAANACCYTTYQKKQKMDAQRKHTGMRSIGDGTQHAVKESIFLNRFILAAVMGFVAFFWFTGGSILNPSNVAWMLNQLDPGQHYVGWSFFRHTPIIQFPLGENSAYGEAIASSIVFTDSIPLLAFIFKLFSSVLPEPFQYFGMWVLLCFVLQAVFACRLLSKFSDDKWLILLATGLFILSPIMLWRLLGGHEALLAHWLILAALNIYFDRDGRQWKWPLLLCLSATVHAYLTAMVMTIWAADLVQQLDTIKRNWKIYIQQIALALLLLFLTMWSVGYFYGGSVGQSGFGIYRFNLNAFIDPEYMWSRFIPSQAVRGGDYEGFAYLGVGVLLLIPLAAIAWYVRASTRKIAWNAVYPLIILCLGCLWYAASNKIAFAGHEILTYEWPKFLAPISYTFRVSGRFIWPLVYVLELALFVAVFSVRKRGVASIALALLLALQTYDLESASAALKTRWAQPWTSPLVSSFWADLPGKYKRIEIVLPNPYTEGYLPFAVFAASHGMKINAGYFARIDFDKFQVSRASLLKSIERGDFADDTVYVFLNDDQLWSSAQQKIKQHDFVGVVDGYKIIAGNYK